MKQSLQLSIGQQLTLTPQLQQAIRLLQLSTIDLQQEIQQIIESNPMLEAVPNEEKDEPTVESNTAEDEFADFQWSQLYSGSKNNNLMTMTIISTIYTVPRPICTIIYIGN